MGWVLLLFLATQLVYSYLLFNHLITTKHGVMFLERKGRIFQGRVLHSPHDSQHVDTFFLHFLISRLLVGGGVVVCANTHAEDKQIPSGRLFFFFFFKSSFRR